MTEPVIGFDSSSGVRVNLDQLVASRLLIQANSGGGKSRLLRYLLEQTHGKVQQVVIDPEGEFASLRERFDYLLAGREGDIPADAKTAKIMARRILELGASTVIDLYDLQLDQRRKFVRLFLTELMNLPRSMWRPLLVVIDEAHVFCPERGSGEAESSESVITLCTQGRKRGFAALLATQRISKLHKDAAAELLNKLIGRTGLDVDVKRAGDELGFDKEQRQKLKFLEPGTFYAYGPAIAREVLIVRSGPITTTHPEPGKISPPAPPPPAAVKRMVAQMQDLAAKADEEARTEAELREQLTKAQRTIRQLERGAPAATTPDPSVIEKQVATAVDRARREWSREAETAERELRVVIAAQEKKMGKVTAVAEQLLAVLRNGNVPPVPANRIATVVARPVAPVRSAPRQPRSAAPASTGSALPKGEHAVLTAACQYPDGVTREQVSILTGYKRSSRDAYIQRLRERGLVEIRGDAIVAAEGAEDHLGGFQPLPTGDELREYWLERLPAGECAVLQVLIDSYPDAATRDQISDATEYKRSSRDAYLQRLNARKLVNISGGSVSAAAFLFDTAQR